MKKVLFVPILVVACAIAFADMTIVQKISTGPVMGKPGQTDIMTMQIKGSKGRVDFQSGKTSQIMDAQTGKVYILEHSKKQVMVVPAEMMKAAGDVLSQMGGGQGMNINFQKTGKKQIINGFNCDEYTMTSSGLMNITAVYWITNDVDTKEFQPFKSFADSLLKMMGSAKTPEGMPIRTESKMDMMGQNITTNTEVQQISHKPVPESIFEVPKDYTIKEMPSPPKHH